VPGPILEFGDVRLDCDRFQLRRGGRVLRLERKPMELLIFLATREGDIVTRSEIARCLWGNEVFVDTEHGINTAIRKVRQALRDDPEQPRYVQTVTAAATASSAQSSLLSQRPPQTLFSPPRRRKH
jgi:DNA-binding response OmpR family regulator